MKKILLIIFFIFLQIIINNYYLEGKWKIIWEKLYDSGTNDEAYGIAVDNNGYVYVTGKSYNGANYDYFTVKYDSSGNIIWTQRYDGGTNEEAYGIAVDNNGYVYVTGGIYGTSYDYLTIKYDSSGNTIWTKKGEGKGYDITTDNNGYVYVTGNRYIGISEDYFTIKYDSSGNTIWTQSYDGGDWDLAKGIAVDNNGYVYVTGESCNGPSYDYLTIKYDSSGNTIWTQRYDGGNWDLARGVAVDNNGYVYVTGGSHNGTNYDYFTIKYSPSGNAIWFERYSLGSYANDIAIDSRNYIYITGELSRGFNDNDYFTIKYDSSGNTIWTQRYDSGTNDEAYGIAVDNNGYVYVTGYSYNGINNDYCTIKYEQPLYPYPYFLSISAIRIDDYVKITWCENMVNERGYKIYRSYNKANYNLIGIESRDSKEYIDNSVNIYSGEVYYRIVATNAVNEKSIDVVVNMEKVYNIKDIIVVPNPYKYEEKNKKILFYNVIKGIKIYIYNILGRKIKEIDCNEENGNKVSWDVEENKGEIRKGVYIAKIKNITGDTRYIPILIK